MLARPDTRRCVECGTPYDSPNFHYHYGRVDQGAAYWSDRGILCSPRCAMTHHKRRAAEGTLPDAPAPDPFDIKGY
jgi:recombinational DNA repair protein (RecF pathway)